MRMQMMYNAIHILKINRCMQGITYKCINVLDPQKPMWYNSRFLENHIYTFCIISLCSKHTAKCEVRSSYKITTMSIPKLDLVCSLW